MVAAVAAIACDMAYHLTTDFAVSCGFLHMLAGSFALCDVKGRCAGKSIAACQMISAFCWERHQVAGASCARPRTLDAR